MKKRDLLLALVVLFLASSGSSGQRALGTPAERLIGHWGTNAGDHMYFGAAKSEGIGSYILVKPNGETELHKYEIVSQIPEGEQIILKFRFSDGNWRIETFIIQKDGMKCESTARLFGMTVKSELKYIDGKIEP